MKYRTHEITLTEDGNYRPNAILVDGTRYTMAAYEAEYGYNWKATASGNHLYYKAEDGRTIMIPQKTLFEAGKADTSLKRIRKAAGLSQTKLAEAVGVPYRTIQKYENGEADPANMTLGLALKLAEALNVEPADLID